MEYSKLCDSDYRFMCVVWDNEPVSSGLFFSLSTEEMLKGFYIPHRRAKNPIHNDDIIYTPDVTVFKTDSSNPTLMSEKNWYKIETCGNRYKANKANAS